MPTNPYDPIHVRNDPGENALIAEIVGQFSQNYPDFIRSALADGVRVQLAKLLMKKGISPGDIALVRTNGIISGEQWAAEVLPIATLLLEFQVQMGVPPALVKMLMEHFNRASALPSSIGQQPLESSATHSSEVDVPNRAVPVTGTARRTIERLGVSSDPWNKNKM